MGSSLDGALLLDWDDTVNRKLRYVLLASFLMWFPIDFFFHEVVGLFPETVIYYTLKTIVLGLTTWLVLLGYLGRWRSQKHRSILELSLLTGFIGAVAFGIFYWFLYYIPWFLPVYASPQLLVTNLLGWHRVPQPVTMFIFDSFALIHFVSNAAGSAASAIIFLSGHDGF
jgi:hypothetical protein